MYRQSCHRHSLLCQGKLGIRNISDNQKFGAIQQETGDRYVALGQKMSGGPSGSAGQTHASTAG
jgi:hypothetical protein